MTRSKLRSKAGCNTCRGRRKKCDEAKPSCGYCRTRDISCEWTYAPRDSHRCSTTSSYAQNHQPDDVTCHEIARALHDDDDDSRATSPSFLVKPSLTPLQTDFADKRFHPRFVVPSFLTTFVTPMSKPEFVDWTPWLGIIQSQSYARDAAMAFGASWMSLSDKSMIVPCFKFYESSVSGLRNALLEESTTPSIETCLVTSYFLGLLEIYWSKDFVKPMYHLSAIARMLDLERRKLRSQRSESTVTLCYVVAETVLYNITNNAIFVEELDAKIQAWKDLEGFFKEVEENRADAYVLSPLLAGRRDVYHLMMKIFWLCRQDLSLPHIRNHIQASQKQQEKIAGDIDAAYGSKFSTDMLKRYTSRQTIQTLALQVLLLKLENPHRCSAEPVLFEATNAALHAVREQYTTRTPMMSDGLSWPLCVLLCFIDGQAAFEEVVTITEDYLTIMAPGLQHRMKMALSTIVAERRPHPASRCTWEAEGSCVGNHDATMLLLRPRGILC